jgi:hypothetical protein
MNERRQDHRRARASGQPNVPEQPKEAPPTRPIETPPTPPTIPTTPNPMPSPFPDPSPAPVVPPTRMVEPFIPRPRTHAFAFSPSVRSATSW